MTTVPTMGVQPRLDSAAGADAPKESSSNSSIDSGYSSQSASTNGTPNTTPNSKLPAAKKTSISRDSPIPFPLTGLRKQKAAAVAPILDKEIDEPTRRRFAAIQPSFERLLLEHMRSSKRPGATYKPMSTRLVMMGVPGQDPSPYIVVFCQPEQRDSVRRFAKQGIVKDLCGEGEAGVRPLKVTVIGTAPRLRVAISVTADAARLGDAALRTLCGTPIRLIHPSGSKSTATFGGIVRILTATGEIRLYGLTAGHVLAGLEDLSATFSSDTCTGQQDNNVQPRLKLASRPSTKLSDDPDEEESDEGSDDDLDLNLSCEQLGMDLESQSRPWAFVDSLELGTVIYPNLPLSLNQDSFQHDYDWALFETNLYELNYLPSDRRARVVLTERTPGRTGNRAVSMISASAGVKRGQLLSEAGRIIIGSGEEFVDAYMVTFGGQTSICDGDSGSWVVDCLTFELYGYLVASDVFNGGYVMPITRVFQDIKQHLGATSVELPSTVDILHARTMAAGVALIDNDMPTFSPVFEGHWDDMYNHFSASIPLDQITGARTPLAAKEEATQEDRRLKRARDSGYSSAIPSLEGSPQKRMRKNSVEESGKNLPLELPNFSGSPGPMRKGKRK
ncbi:hypothetical protein GQ53DRAFT_836861 [Thozetella sp. PMI_491]|nr:hypothetical protein GQ53DRAFT_836861 [Thozetella sp. PMI_491]